MKFLTTFLFYFFSFLLFSQNPVSFQLTEKDGLPDIEFYTILEDNKGFVWLAADKGLFRYNGKDCVYSALAPDQNNEQSVDFMLSLFTDSTWVFVNPKHDFPNKIEYQLLSSRMMKVDVTGIEKGKPRSLSFSLIKKP